MRYYVMAVKDLAAQTFGQSFVAKHPNEAVRSFTDEVNRAPDVGGQNNLWAHPDDFELYCVGQYDDSTGELIPNSPIELIVQAKHVSKRPPGVPSPHLALNGGMDSKSVVM